MGLGIVIIPNGERKGLWLGGAAYRGIPRPGRAQLSAAGLHCHVACWFGRRVTLPDAGRCPVV